MPDTIEDRDGQGQPASLWRRLGWFLALYLAGLIAVTLTAAGLRALMDLTLR